MNITSLIATEVAEATSNISYTSEGLAAKVKLLSTFHQEFKALPDPLPEGMKLSLWRTEINFDTTTHEETQEETNNAIPQ